MTVSSLQSIDKPDNNDTVVLKTVGISLILGIITYSLFLFITFSKRSALSPPYLYLVNAMLCTYAIVIGIGIFFMLNIIIVSLKNRLIINRRSLLWGAGMFASVIPFVVLYDMLSRTILSGSTWPLATITMLFSIGLAILSAGPLTMGLWNPRKNIDY